MGGVKIPYTVPHWKTYQVGDHTPELQNVQRRLAAVGLKDPWLRNEVWRFDRRVINPWYKSAFNTLKRGFIPGLVLALISTAYTKYSSRHDHHHDDHHHEKH